MQLFYKIKVMNASMQILLAWQFEYKPCPNQYQELENSRLLLTLFSELNYFKLMNL